MVWPFLSLLGESGHTRQSVSLPTCHLDSTACGQGGAVSGLFIALTAHITAL